MAPNFKELHGELIQEIQGVNRYNPNNIPKLETCVQLMVKENMYDKDILLTILKLYQLNPSKYVFISKLLKRFFNLTFQVQ